jgi:hypothetical protein
MRVLYGLVDVSICRKCCEPTTKILYPIGSKIPRPNISFADRNRSVYRGLGVTTQQFRFEPHKFAATELTPLASEAVKPARARECPVHMEARVIALHELKPRKAK